MRQRRLLIGNALLFAVGVPVAGLAVVVGCTVLDASGPEVLAEGAGGILLGLVGFFVGYGLVLFSQLRYLNVLVFFGAFFTLFFGISGIDGAVEERLLLGRGETTDCTVLTVDERVETSTDSDGDTTTNYYYDHRLACADPRVEAMTTTSEVAAPGDDITVLHDPAGRLSTRPAASVDPASELTTGSILFGIGVALRILSELRVPLFRSQWDHF